MKEYDITVIGDINVDLILRGEDVVPSFGQKEKLVDDAILTMGGSGGIFACGAGNLGLRLNFIITMKLSKYTYQEIIGRADNLRGYAKVNLYLNGKLVPSLLKSEQFLAIPCSHL